MKTITYTPKGVCSRNINITVNDDGIIEKVQFTRRMQRKYSRRRRSLRRKESFRYRFPY